MRALFFDAVFFEGHKSLDTHFIENLSNVSDLTVMCPSNWYSSAPRGATYVFRGKETNFRKLNHARIIFDSLINCHRAARIAKQTKPDVIILGEFEIITLKRFIKAFKKSSLFIVYHYNLDQANRRGFLKKLLKKSKEKVQHVVIQKYFISHLIDEYCVDCKRIHFWPDFVAPLMTTFSDKEYDCVGLSNSNSQHLVQSIINREIETGFLRKRGYHVVIKSKDGSFDDGYLKVISGFIAQDEFDNYMNKAKSVLVCYPYDYVYRSSGIIDDAISRKLPVIGSDFYLLRKLKNDFPHIFYTLNDSADLANVLSSVLDSPDSVSRDIDFNRFFCERSSQSIQNAMRESLEKSKS